MVASKANMGNKSCSTRSAPSNPGQNGQIEEAVYKVVKAYFEKSRYQVFSREKESIGYDFDVSSKDGQFPLMESEF
jgi:hypothetical protein